MLCSHCEDRLCPILGVVARQKMRTASLYDTLSLKLPMFAPAITIMEAEDTYKYARMGCPLAQYMRDQRMLENVRMQTVSLVHDLG